jgi:alpha-N-arabinofuranosidase
VSRTKSVSIPLGFLLLPLVAKADVSPPNGATIDIQIQSPVAKVSPTLYGLMTEEINHSYDGGLYAELVGNRALKDEDWMPVRWTMFQNSALGGTMTFDQQTGPSAAVARSLKLVVTKAAVDDPVGVQNEGFWGISLRGKTTYKGSFYAKADHPAMGAVTVSLVNNDSGKVLAKTVAEPLGTEWKQYHVELHTGVVVPSAANTLVLAVEKPGTVWFSLVSLFPPTFASRANGNRTDIMEKLAALRPKFLRFPGGNYLEGNHIGERFDWKKTVGALVDRPGHRSPWGYHSTDGMGLLEFLGWCEDLNMEPVLAVYGGYSLEQEYVRPGRDLEPYVQDALDEIEYVTGGPETKWGGVRASQGHPAPFPLTYVEIGNEDNFDKSKTYDARFAQFFDAIKKKYPKLQIIGSTSVKSRVPDVLDDHYYRLQSEFYTDTHHYDKVDRKGPKIFVGEWATLEGTPTGSFGAALSDAAWMTGMERNSDIIVMAAYAPLLTNVNPSALQWRTNLIGYDASTSYGSPSYYAQVMFSNSLGDEVVESKLQDAGPLFFYSVTRDVAKHRLYLKLVNASPRKQEVELNLAGASKVEGRARLTTLTAKTPLATNSITSPKSVVPVTTAVTGLRPTFKHTMPAYSIQVLDLGVE